MALVKKPLRPGDPGYNTRVLAGGGMGVYSPPPLKVGSTVGGVGTVRGTSSIPYLEDIGAWSRQIGAPVNTNPYPPNVSPGDIPAIGTDVRFPGSGGGAGGAAVGHDPINIHHAALDYHGLLNQYKNDWQARLNAGLAANEAQRQSSARAAINRLGVRDPNAMFAQLQKYGLTLQDLQGAADNPWSDLKAIQQQADRARGQGMADFAGRGTFRSGGTAQMVEDVEQQRARTEAQSTQEALAGLDTGLFNQAEWERQQRDQGDQMFSGMEAQMAQAYQPYDTQATWDPNQGGYRFQNQIYDQYGNLIRTV